MLEEALQKLEDHRRGEGKRYDLANVVLCVILAVLSDARSYRRMHTFIETHFVVLRERLGLRWKKAPSYTGLRDILQGIKPESLEAMHRAHAAALLEKSATDEENGQEKRIFACDGKTLRRSFDTLQDRKAAHILSVFAQGEQIILAHAIIDEKSNEIPAFQQLIEELNLTGAVFTMDALHTQKKQQKP